MEIFFGRAHEINREEFNREDAKDAKSREAEGRLAGRMTEDRGYRLKS